MPHTVINGICVVSFKNYLLQWRVALEGFSKPFINAFIWAVCHIYILHPVEGVLLAVHFKCEGSWSQQENLFSLYSWKSNVAIIY